MCAANVHGVSLVVGIDCKMRDFRHLQARGVAGVSSGLPFVSCKDVRALAIQLLSVCGGRGTSCPAPLGPGGGTPLPPPPLPPPPPPPFPCGGSGWSGPKALKTARLSAGSAPGTCPVTASMACPGIS